MYMMLASISHFFTLDLYMYWIRNFNIEVHNLFVCSDLVIGFERRIFYTNEPPGPFPSPFNEIRLVKENNVLTEQTFQVDITVQMPVNYTAATARDFFLLTGGVQTFRSDVQFIQLRTLVLADTVFDGDKAVQFFSAPPPPDLISGIRPYSLPSTGITFQTTTLVIRDFQGEVTYFYV